MLLRLASLLPFAMITLAANAQQPAASSDDTPQATQADSSPDRIVFSADELPPVRGEPHHPEIGIILDRPDATPEQELTLETRLTDAIVQSAERRPF